MRTQHFLMHSHYFFLPQLILIKCAQLWGSVLYKIYFLLIFAIVIAILSGNKVKKRSWMQLRAFCALYLFASAEVNGIREGVVNRNAQEQRRVKRQRVGESERGGRSSPGVSLRIWELLANLSNLPPHWQVLPRDELCPEHSLLDMQHRQATEREARPKHNSEHIASPQAHVHSSILYARER